MSFDQKVLGIKSTRDESLISFFKSPAIMASGLSTIISPENPNELFDRYKMFLKEKQGGNISDEFNEKLLQQQIIFWNTNAYL